MMEELKNKLKKKEENGKTLYFYAGLGWVDEERLNQPDVKRQRIIKTLCVIRKIRIIAKTAQRITDSLRGEEISHVDNNAAGQIAIVKGDENN